MTKRMIMIVFSRCRKAFKNYVKITKEGRIIFSTL